MAKRIEYLFFTLLLGTAALFVYALFLIDAAPVEATMGIVQKIFYFHVPSAYLMYVGAGFCFLGSVWYLSTGSKKADAWAFAGAEVSVLCGLMVLISGPLWARKAWGTYWTWDPRLTTTMLALLIYVAYNLLRRFGGRGEAERKFAAALGILGVADVPIIHFSVQKWSGQHPTVITAQGGGLDPRMSLALGVSFLAFTGLGILLLWVRSRNHFLAEQLAQVEERAVDLSLITDPHEF